MGRTKGWDDESVMRHNFKMQKQAISLPLNASFVQPTVIGAHNIINGVATIYIKPLSVNDVWKGRRFRTDTYDQYEKAIIRVLPPLSLPAPPFKVTFKFGMSSKGSDVDNCIKPLQDVLAGHYKFNDNQIYELHVYKKIVKKGEEYFSFIIESLVTT